MLKFCVTMGVGLALVYGGLLVIASLMQRNMQYFPTHVDRQAAGNEIFKPWRDVAGQFWGYIRPSDSPRRIVIFFHGNGGEALSRTWLSEMIPDRDVMLVLAEYPGYGARPGDPTEKLIFQEARLVIDTVRLKWQLTPLTVVGESLGSGVACSVAAEKEIDRLALISPFTSAAAVGAHHYPFLPVQWLMKDRFDNMKIIDKLKAPAFMVHGEKDQVVPIEFGRELYRRYPAQTKRFLSLPDYGHNDLVPALISRPETKDFRNFIAGN